MKKSTARIVVAMVLVLGIIMAMANFSPTRADSVVSKAVSYSSVVHNGFHAYAPQGCADHETYYGTNSSYPYTIQLTVHYVWSGGCFASLYTTAEAYVAAGYSFNIRVCTGQAPEAGHLNEVCHDYSGTAPFGGWYSPVFDSYTWGAGGINCDGYADIQGHVGLASNIEDRGSCPYGN